MPDDTFSDDFLSKAADVAFAGVNQSPDASNFSRPRRVFITVYSAQPVIDNGGFGYFFERDWPGKPPYSNFSEAYREIGSTEVAALIEQAAKLFGISDPHLHREARLRYLNEHCRDDSGELIELGDRAIGQSKRVFRLLAEYTQRHASEFVPT